MRTSTFALKNRSELNLSDFKGVDLSNSLLNISPNRASRMENFINKNGSNQKRNGWEEIFKFVDNDGNTLPIFGIFKFRELLVIHAGNKIYYTEDLTEGWFDVTGDIEISFERSQAFANGDKLYIIGCGDYLVFGDFDNGYELRRVVDDAYIPTTTINIDSKGSADTNRSVLDSVNLLSKWRKNTLLGRKFIMYDESNQETSLEWVLDSSIDKNSHVTIEAHHLEEGTGEDFGIFFHWFYRFENTGEDKTALYLTYESLDGVDRSDYMSTDIQGRIYFEEGRILLFREIIPIIQGQSNITVTFQHKIFGAAEQITQCKFGSLFGINGQANKLFLSGNSEHPNNDYHTGFTGEFEDVALLLDDFSYFPADNISQIGTPNSKITGYSRLSDNTQVILKDGNLGEPGIYMRVGELRKTYDDNEKLMYAKEVFQHSPCVMVEGGINAWTSANFNGDSLVLTRNGVMGITLTNNLQTERVLRERSYLINEKLKKAIAESPFIDDWISIVYDNKYFLTNGNGTVYVADSRFKVSNENDIDGSFNYEWWVWTNVPVKIFAIIGNVLCFGTADGRLCRFYDGFTDNTSVFAGYGSLSIDRENHCFVYNEKLHDEIVENNLLTLGSNDDSSLYEELTVEKVESGKIYLSVDDILNLRIGDSICAGYGSYSNFNIYNIDKIDRGCLYIEASGFDDSGNEISLASRFATGWKIYSGIRFTDDGLFITNVTDSTFQVKRSKDSKPILLSNFDGKNAAHTSISAKITHKRNVVAKWFTPIFDLGSSTVSKTLLRIILTTEPYIKSKLSIGYETAISKGLVNPQQRGNGFSFDDLDFNSFSFETGFASSCSVRVNKRNFNYIMLKITSDSDGNCSINTLSLIFKTNKMIKGVM